MADGARRAAPPRSICRPHGYPLPEDTLPAPPTPSAQANELRHTTASELNANLAGMPMRLQRLGSPRTVSSTFFLESSIFRHDSGDCHIAHDPTPYKDFAIVKADIDPQDQHYAGSANSMLAPPFGETVRNHVHQSTAGLRRQVYTDNSSASMSPIVRPHLRLPYRPQRLQRHQRLCVIMDPSESSATSRTGQCLRLHHQLDYRGPHLRQRRHHPHTVNESPTDLQSIPREHFFIRGRFRTAQFQALTINATSGASCTRNKVPDGLPQRLLHHLARPHRTLRLHRRKLAVPRSLQRVERSDDQPQQQHPQHSAPVGRHDPSGSLSTRFRSPLSNGLTGFRIAPLTGLPPCHPPIDPVG